MTTHIRILSATSTPISWHAQVKLQSSSIIRGPDRNGWHIHITIHYGAIRKLNMKYSTNLADTHTWTGELFATASPLMAEEVADSKTTILAFRKTLLMVSSTVYSMSTPSGLRFPVLVHINTSQAWSVVQC